MTMDGKIVQKLNTLRTYAVSKYCHKDCRVGFCLYLIHMEIMTDVFLPSSTFTVTFIRQNI